jgi:hypothetical protein
VLSVRDAAGWEKSFSETIVEMCLGNSLMPLLSNARAEIDPRWKRYLGLVDRMFWSGTAPFTGGTSSEALMRQAEAFNQNVRDAVPADRLLEWSVSEGWGPLCEFLGVDVPAEPLPHENDRETFIGRVTDGAINALHDWQQQRLAQQPA